MCTEAISYSTCSLKFLCRVAYKLLHVTTMKITTSPHVVACSAQDELPEALLGAVRLQNLDLSKAAVLDLETGAITRRS